MPADELILVLVILLGIAMLLTGVSRKLPIPHTILLVIVGIALGRVADSWAPLAPLRHFQLGPEIMFFIFLPALIFESGFSIDTRQLHRDLPPILMLAIPAMLLSTCVVGLGVWWLLDIPLIVALVFGALISATDPVAVVALFKELGAPNRLNVLVEGESLLNDATAIVAFTILLGIAMQGGGIGWSDSGPIIAEFLRVFIGGVIVGSLLGFAVCELLYRMRSDMAVILTTSIVIAYASFVLAEHALHVSGVMAVVGSAIALKRFSMIRFPHDATHAIHSSWEVISLSCNSLLFLLVGLTVKFDNIMAVMGAVVLVVILILSARAFAVYSVIPVTVKLFHLPRISMAERHIMWWGGLKGGLAIAVVLSIPEALPEKQFLFDLTVGVVLFTLLVSAPTIRPLMERLGLNQLTEGEDLELRNSLITARKESASWLGELRNYSLLTKRASKGLLIRIRLAFSIGMFDEGSEKHDDDEYMALFRAYQTERTVLMLLYESEIISQYIYLRMNDSLFSMQEALRKGKNEHNAFRDSSRKSLFVLLEGGLLRYSRERLWLSKLLSRYQSLRLVQQMERHIAKVIISNMIIDMLEQQDDLARSARELLIANYQTRNKHYRHELKMAKRQFPGFYRRHMENTAHRSMINRGWNHVQQQHSQGTLGAKGYNIIRRKVEQELASISHVRAIRPDSDASVSALLDEAALFENLSSEDLNLVKNNATGITFLAGDTIVGEAERGDNFYIIIHGKVAVRKQDESGATHKIATFHDGDIIGESSLVEAQSGAHRRSATIVAKTPCKLLRVTRKAMLTIVGKYPDVRQYLQKIHGDRLG
ncbi:cation:proton antiporter [Candidatus Spongiihabitans sp.]|uniref:cation:proton antiporter n=1 Tax=Candidatus Spongiihabitans sp. TaxID=3101308 RepID=UPI003C79D901